MPNIQNRLPLRQTLIADAVLCGAMGGLLVVLSGFISGATQIPALLLSYAGFSLFPIAAFIAFVALRSGRDSAGVWMVIAGNALWVLASFVLVFGLIAPNALGIAFIAGQATVVALLAWLEFTCLSVLEHNAGRASKP